VKRSLQLSSPRSDASPAVPTSAAIESTSTSSPRRASSPTRYARVRPVTPEPPAVSSG
jgi:hypothetical protein